MCDTYASQRGSLFIRENLIFSSERMLHKDYEKSLVVSFKGLDAKTK
jgi:hypothetical protein